MEYYEQRNALRGLKGLFDGFEQRTLGMQSVVNAHIHEYFELLYCTSGKYELTIERQRMTLSCGDVVLIRPMQPHQTRTLYGGENRYIVLQFIPECLLSFAQPIDELQYIFPFMHTSKQDVQFYSGGQIADTQLGEWVRTILREYLQKAYGYEMAIRTHIELVVLWFIRQWQPRSGVMPMNEEHLEIVKSVLQYVADNLGEAITVHELAAAFNMGSSTFSRFFNLNLGESLPSYIRRLRLTKAANELMQSDKTITEIASELGFSSTSYFVMCFREQNGITPKKFRDNTKRKPDKARRT